MKTFFSSKGEVFVGQLPFVYDRWQVRNTNELWEELMSEGPPDRKVLYFFVKDDTAPEGLREASVTPAGPDGWWTREQAEAVWKATASRLPDLYRRKWVTITLDGAEYPPWCQDYYHLLGNLCDHGADTLTFTTADGKPVVVTWQQLLDDKGVSFCKGAPAKPNANGYIPHVQPDLGPFPEYA